LLFILVFWIAPILFYLFWICKWWHCLNHQDLWTPMKSNSALNYSKIPCWISFNWKKLTRFYNFFRFLNYHAWCFWGRTRTLFEVNLFYLKYLLFILVFWIAPIMIWYCLNWTEWWGRLTLGPHSALIFHNFWQKKASYNFFAKFSFSEKATKIWAKAELYLREHSHMKSSQMFLRYFWTTYPHQILSTWAYLVKLNSAWPTYLKIWLHMWNVNAP
jgi:hypothetical protein